MKSIFKYIILFLLFFSVTKDLISQVKVKGYYRKDGTYVQPHYRSNPDGNPYNNWSYPGNTNPYTGKTATGNENTYLENYYNNNSKNSTYDYSGSNLKSTTYSFSGTGNVIIYTDEGDYGEIYVFVDGEYSGYLDQYFESGEPAYYGEDATISFSVKGGYHKIEAIGKNGGFWSNSMPIYGNTNNMLKLSK